MRLYHGETLGYVPTPIIPFLGYAGDFRIQRHNALERAREDGICVCTLHRTDAVGLDFLPMDGDQDMPILNPLVDDLSGSSRWNPKADFVRFSDLQPMLMNARTRNASILNWILEHELNWAEAHKAYTAHFYAKKAAEKDKQIQKAEEQTNRVRQESADALRRKSCGRAAGNTLIYRETKNAAAISGFSEFQTLG